MSAEQLRELYNHGSDKRNAEHDTLSIHIIYFHQTELYGQHAFKIEERTCCPLCLPNPPVDTSIHSPRTFNLGRAGGTLCGRGHSMRTVLPSCADSERRRPSSYSDISVGRRRRRPTGLELSARSPLPSVKEGRRSAALEPELFVLERPGLFIVAPSDSIQACCGSRSGSSPSCTIQQAGRNITHHAGKPKAH